MANKENNKLKLLLVKDILSNEADAAHPLNATQICEMLKRYEIYAERKSIYADINVLEDYGLEVCKVGGRNGGYYIYNSEFEPSELKLLIDAISASKFISVKQTKSFAERIAKLTNKYEAASLSRELVAEKRSKLENEKIMYIVDDIFEAIDKNCKIQFNYTTWDMNKKKVDRYNGKPVVVSPAYLVWFDENYYLIAYKHGGDREGIRYYRVDKMINVVSLEEMRENVSFINKSEVSRRVSTSFGMFQGEPEKVTIRCNRKDVGVLIDRFGTDVDIRPDGEDALVRVEVEVSNQFFGWLIAVGDICTVEGPVDVKEKYLEHLDKVLSKY